MDKNWRKRKVKRKKRNQTNSVIIVINNNNNKNNNNNQETRQTSTSVLISRLKFFKGGGHGGFRMPQHREQNRPYSVCGSQIPHLFGTNTASPQGILSTRRQYDIVTGFT